MAIPKFKPVDNKIVLRKVEAGQTTESGIYVGKTKGVDKAEVLRVGPQVISTQVGDVLLVDWKQAVEVELGNDKFYIIIPSAIVGIFEEGYEDSTIEVPESLVLTK